MEQMQEIKANKNAVRTLSAGHFVIDNFSAFSTPILPLIATKLGTNMAVLASVLSIGHLCSSIFQPVFGYVADRWRKRFFLVFGLLLGALFNSLIGVAPNLWSLALCVALGSLGTGFFHPQATSMMVIFSEKNENVKEIGRAHV